MFCKYINSRKFTTVYQKKTISVTFEIKKESFCRSNLISFLLNGKVERWTVVEMTIFRVRIVLNIWKRLKIYLLCIRSYIIMLIRCYQMLSDKIKFNDIGAEMAIFNMNKHWLQAVIVMMIVPWTANFMFAKQVWLLVTRAQFIESTFFVSLEFLIVRISKVPLERKRRRISTINMLRTM